MRTLHLKTAAVALAVLVTIVAVSVVTARLRSGDGLTASDISGPTISVSRDAPIVKGARPLPTGAELRALIDQLTWETPENEVVSMEIVPTTFERAEDFDHLGHSGRGDDPAYLVIQHGSFSCLPGCLPPDLDDEIGEEEFASARSSEKMLIVDAASGRIVVAGGIEDADLSGLGPIATVTNLPEEFKRSN